MKMIEDLGMQYATPNSKQKTHFAIYECPYCSKLTKMVVRGVKIGTTKSCGCISRFKKGQKAHNFKHIGITKRIGNIWRNMLKRCYSPKHKSFERYSKKGITVCAEWKNDFKIFYDWAMANGYKDDLVLDRINNGKGYFPDNCRWTTYFVNLQNTDLKKNNTSGYRGVYHQRGRWVSQITSFGKRYYIGCFGSAVDAALAYNNWVIEHGTHHTLNNIQTH